LLASNFDPNYRSTSLVADIKISDAMKILLVDDHNLFRNGLKMLIDTIPGFTVTGEASNAKEFLEIIKTEQFDVIFLDIEMPDMNGIEAARMALKSDPGLKIITLTMYGDQEYFDQMVNAGAKGFLLKNSDILEVKSAIEAVCQGGTYYSQELMQTILANLKQAKEPKSSTCEFSEREAEILGLICTGLSNQAIGEKLFISKRTVEKHRANLLLKTNSKNTADLVIYAIKNQAFTP
jgi:DNA-binding NarL/FixJ family response regulator